MSRASRQIGQPGEFNEKTNTAIGLSASVTLSTAMASPNPATALRNVEKALDAMVAAERLSANLLREGSASLDELVRLGR